MSTGGCGITAVILTFNEELHIARALASIGPLAARVVVVDSFSSDSTVELARQAGAEVYQHEFVNQAKQLAWALDNTNIHTEWVMRLDADEVVGDDLICNLHEAIRTADDETNGFVLQRRHIFMGRWIRFGGRYPVEMLRIWRRGCAVVEDAWMDEHMVLVSGRSRKVAGVFEDRNLKSISEFVDKHNGYATREAIQIILTARGKVHGAQLRGASAGARLKRLLKNGLYNRLPFEISAVSYFCFRYFLQLGFLDGRAGAIYHFLQAFWYRFLVGAKVHEIRQALGSDRLTDAQLRERLAAVTGYSAAFFR